MFLRRLSILRCTSTTGTSVTTPRAASSRLRILPSRSSRVSVQSGGTMNSSLPGSFLASPRCLAVSCKMASMANIRRRACS